MPDCIFCAIVAGAVPASVVYDDATVLAFMDIQPVTPGHLLVIPKRHATDLAELDEAMGKEVFAVAHRLAAALRHCGIRCEGVNLFLADGAAAGQEVFHVHLHAFPRYAGDSFGSGDPFTHGLDRAASDVSLPSRADLDALAASTRAALPRDWRVSGTQIDVERSCNGMTRLTERSVMLVEVWHQRFERLSAVWSVRAGHSSE